MSDEGKRGDKPGDASFLSRWSRRKIDARSDTAVPTNAGMQKSSVGAPSGTNVPATPLPERTSPSEPQTRKELPSIDSLTHEADFSPFMAKDVDPGMRNQAMKKLFADPHYQFEQMDRLDIYLDDYSKPDPIPPEMLRMMYQSKSLGLFDHEKEPEETIALDGDTGDVISADVDAPSIEDSPGDALTAGIAGADDEGSGEAVRDDHQVVELQETVNQKKSS